MQGSKDVVCPDAVARWHTENPRWKEGARPYPPGPQAVPEKVFTARVEEGGDEKWSEWCTWKNGAQELWRDREAETERAGGTEHTTK